MKIVQILLWQVGWGDPYLLGLGNDGKVYEYDFDEFEWQPLTRK